MVNYNICDIKGRSNYTTEILAEVGHFSFLIFNISSQNNFKTWLFYQNVCFDNLLNILWFKIFNKIYKKNNVSGQLHQKTMVSWPKM